MYYIIRSINKKTPDYYFYSQSGKMVDYRTATPIKKYKSETRARHQVDILAKKFPMLSITLVVVDYEVKDYWPDDCTIASRYASTLEQAEAIASSGEIQGAYEIVTRERSIYTVA